MRDILLYLLQHNLCSHSLYIAMFIGALNEAVFYMSYLPEYTKKIIVIKKSRYPKKTETLAEYYYRTYMHLLEGITLMEVDAETDSLSVIV